MQKNSYKKLVFWWGMCIIDNMMIGKWNTKGDEMPRRLGVLAKMGAWGVVGALGII